MLENSAKVSPGLRSVCCVREYSYSPIEGLCMIDSKSLSELLPGVKSLAIHFIALAEMTLSDKLLVPVKIIVTSTYRDSERQDALYAQGRTTPGKIVTRARGGDSWHNHRCAFDVAIKLGETITWDRSYYRLLGPIAKEVGLTWGGDWNGDGVEQPEDFDLVHFQYTGGLTLADLKAGKEIEFA